jgi:hypothetical protein
MRDTVDMVREAGIIHPEMVLNNLKAFEALVRADERDKWMERAWVGLTDEEKAQFVVAYYPSNWDRKTAVSLMNDYEKYLKEKNNE